MDMKVLVNALTEFGVDITLNEIFQMWDKRGRYHHTTEFHLFPLLEEIENYEYFENEHDRFMLIVAALFHDIIYDKKGDKDVDNSIMFFRTCVSNHFLNEEQKRIVQIIENTKDHKPKGDKLSDVFNELDLKVLEQPLAGMLQYERNIFLEFQEYPFDKYKERRIEILTSLLRRDRYMLPTLIEYIKNYVPKIGLYAGSFNPFTVAHLNILEKAETIFDKVIVAQLKNPDKDTPSATSLLNLNRELIFSDELLVDIITKVESYADVTLVRGLRNTDDFKEENKLAFYLKEQKPDIKIVYFVSDKEFEYISSSDIRILKKLDSKLADKFII